MSKIELFHCVSARSFRPLWALNEIKLLTPKVPLLNYELKVLPFPPRVFQKDYLKENPLGTIPLLVDGDTRMTESIAITQYLVSKYAPNSNLEVKQSSVEYGDYLNFLHMADTTLTWPQVMILRYRFFEPDARKLPIVAKDYEKWFHARIKSVDAKLSKDGNEYLVENKFTAADIAVGYSLLVSDAIGISKDLPVNVKEYWKRLQERDGFKNAMEEQEAKAVEAGISPRFAGGFEGLSI